MPDNLPPEPRALRLSLLKTQFGVTTPVGCDTGTPMFAFLARLLLVVRSRMRSQARLKAEKLVLRQQDGDPKPQESNGSAAGKPRSAGLGLALSILSLHPECDPGGQAGDCNPVAPPRLPSLLALEVSTAR